ncbi:MAG: VCBS repeat-containing protein [Muribaculaceae bacterium]|nr:VCBS repeat-containing protein [Muribaculaceae bacterium]
MKKVTLFSMLLAGLAGSATAATTYPNFVDLGDINGLFSTGYFHGNAVLVDFNNDGNLELAAKGRDLNNGWATDLFYLSGDGYSFNTRTAIQDPDNCSWERVLVPIDYNLDGNMDLIAANSWGAKLLKGNGDGTFDAQAGIDAEFGLNGEISIDGDDAEKWYMGLTAVADFNGDGYPDIITFCGNPREDQGTPYLFINEGGSGKFTKMEDTGLLPQRGGTIALADVDCDGMPDVAVSGWSDSFGNDCIKVYKNNGNNTFSEMINANGDLALALAGTETGVIRFFDYNNDGYPDLFVTGQSCPNGWAKCANIYKNNAGNGFEKVEAGLPGTNKGGADWCDLNGDGLIDLVFNGETDNGTKTIVAYNNGDGTFKVEDAIMGGHRGGGTVEIGDFNNNLTPDVILMGYNDNGPHFQLYNSMQTRNLNSAPTAPASLSAAPDGNATVFSWEAGTDKQTPAAALRYNLFVKLKNGKLITLVPADPATGKLKQANVDAATTAKTVRLNVASDDIAEWGVQSIDGGKAASAFAKTDVVSAVVEIEAAAATLSLNGNLLTANAAVNAEVYTVAGAKVMSAEMAEGETVALELPAGVYVIKGGATAIKTVVK